MVIAVLGFFLVQSIAAGLLTNAETAARTQVETGVGRRDAQSSLAVLEPPGDPSVAVSTAEATVRSLQQTSGSTGSYVVVVQVSDEQRRRRAAGSARQRDRHGHHPGLARSTSVGSEQRRYRYDSDSTAVLGAQPTTLTYTAAAGDLAAGPGRRRPGCGPYYQLYYVFPFTAEQATLDARAARC